MRLVLAALTCFAAYAQRMMPDPKLTPGALNSAVTQATLKETICSTKKDASGHTWIYNARNVSDATKAEVMRRYGLPLGDLKHVEIDHYYSIEDGGANSIENLWPQYYKGARGYLGARAKDVVETYAHRQICSGKITLAQGQAMVANWLTSYHVIKGKR